MLSSENFQHFNVYIQKKRTASKRGMEKEKTGENKEEVKERRIWKKKNGEVASMDLLLLHLFLCRACDQFSMKLILQLPVPFQVLLAFFDVVFTMDRLVSREHCLENICSCVIRRLN